MVLQGITFSVNISKIRLNNSILSLLFCVLTLFLSVSLHASIVPQIQQVSIKSDSVIFDDSSSRIDTVQRKSFFSEELRIPYKYNSIKVLLKLIDAEDAIFLQYFLEGFDENWSKPIRFPIKEYNNLPPGSYIFFARYVDENMIHGPAISFHFKIIRPFFKTIFAFLFYLIALILFLIMMARIVGYRFARERFRLERIINDRTNALVKEKDKSENLLAKVLPKDTAKELKVRGKVSKKKYEMATVLFSDIQGFTKLAEQMNPEILIDELDHFFFNFDSVVEKFNIEKIKTIGDAYMCAGGIPVKNRTNPVEVVMAALEIQKYMVELHKKANQRNARIWDIRIGIHTGAVIAGVVGYKKLSYDIWGDTVNTASRMESSGEAGKINISGATYELVKDFFEAEYRGKMPVKYKGEIEMYFVKGLKPEFYSETRKGPNKKFFNHLYMLRLLGFKDMLIKKLEDELPENYYFHNIDLIKSLDEQIDFISMSEGVGEDEILLIKSAAYLYVVGYVIDYDQHLKAGCNYGKEVLPGIRYSAGQIKRICELVNSVSFVNKGENIQEDILNDAIYHYLGCGDYIRHSMNLFHELKENEKIASLVEWKVDQTNLISVHEFCTDAARKARETDKREQLKKVIQLMETKGY